MTLQSVKNLIHQKTEEVQEDTKRSAFERNAVLLFLSVLIVSDERKRKTLRTSNNRIKLRQEQKRSKLPEFIDPHQSAEMQQGYDEELK